MVYLEGWEKGVAESKRHIFFYLVRSCHVSTGSLLPDQWIDLTPKEVQHLGGLDHQGSHWKCNIFQKLIVRNEIN